MLSESGQATVLGGIVAFLVTLSLEPLVIAGLRRRGLFDIPVERSSHSAPTPRGGGLAVIAGIFAGVLVAADARATYLLVAVALAAAVGGLEDFRGLGIRARLLLVGACAPVFIAVLQPWETTADVTAVVLVAVAIPWTLAVVNAVNFMDGINGISAVTAIVAGATYASVGLFSGTRSLVVLGIALTAACVAFTPYNLPHARVFLGDVGSYGIGAALAALSLMVVGDNLPLELAIAPLIIYLADTGTTIVRRFRAGEPWHLPHKQHVYQRLVGRGFSHARVTLFVGLVTIACSGLAAVSLTGNAGSRAVADGAMAFIVGLYLAAPRLLAA